jgi:hypothetical protein
MFQGTIYWRKKNPEGEISANVIWGKIRKGEEEKGENV